ncbi:putative transposase [Candidatus Nitrososphaera gargensis Ga9.2]|uniref:Putative transposase n=2 Tax=Candidatus Nitrososphaera gargensis TaxID=497727 RepID=K0IE01_NITGG|nr:putative transposase [Candidatus Nitrososphaera gargensis Ga9.2]
MMCGSGVKVLWQIRKEKTRISQLLHHISKAIVESAKENKIAIVKTFVVSAIYTSEAITKAESISYRSRLNGWSFAEIKRQIEYKARWKGVYQQFNYYQLKKPEAHLSSVHHAGRR